MKYALCNGIKTKASEVSSGAIGCDIWFPDYEVVACVGQYRQFWKYKDEKPVLPEGYENETEWHASWKVNLNDNNVEVVFGNNREHRADIYTGKEVIEIQKSPIDIRIAKERVDFYKKELSDSRVVWIINIEDVWKSKRIETKLTDKKNIFHIIWKNKRLWIYDLAYTTKTDVYLEFNRKSDKLIKFWIHEDRMYGSWFPKENFFNLYLNDIAQIKYKNRPIDFVNDLTMKEEKYN